MSCPLHLFCAAGLIVTAGKMYLWLFTAEQELYYLNNSISSILANCLFSDNHVIRIPKMALGHILRIQTHTANTSTA